MRKPTFGVSDLVRQKPGSAVTENGYMLESSYLGSRLYYPCIENKDGYREADLRLCSLVSHDAAQIDIIHNTK